MNYREQEKYLQRSGIWVMVAVAALLYVGWECASAATALPRSALFVFVLIMLALCASLLYTPDYLQLTVNPEKRPRWQVKIRWRIIAAVVILGMATAHSNHARMLAGGAALWLALMNLIARKAVPGRYFPYFFWATDLFLVAALLSMKFDLLMAAVLLAAAAHLSIVAFDAPPQLWFQAVAGSVILLSFFIRSGDRSSREVNYDTGLVAVAAVLTTWVVAGAQRHHQKNVSSAISELAAFTGYPEEKVRRLWSTSNQELAKNWEAAAIPENDSERMTQWYRDNSELYMFAISAYNLEYKRIISNLKVLRYAKGACLDYGAGNGELVLDMARNGHPAAYYDVDGVSKKFAQYRAAQQKLDIQFASSKEELTKIVQGRGLDTIFSFDVLEHLPDLAGELSFLSSLLNPGGLFMFDLPGGSTKAHPMHLNHTLDFHAHLHSQGMEEKRSFFQKLPFWKQEKYIFVRQDSALSRQHSAPDQHRQT